MLVRDLMTPSPVTVRSGTPVRAALDLLAGHEITALPVVDEHLRILGIVSEVDLLEGRISRDSRRVVADDAGPAALPTVVDDVMSRCTVVVTPETDVFEVGRIFARRRVRSIPVVDASDQVVGIISRSDVVRALARPDDQLQ